MISQQNVPKRCRNVEKLCQNALKTSKNHCELQKKIKKKYGCLSFVANRKKASRKHSDLQQ